MPPGVGCTTAHEKHCRGATRGRPCAVTVDIAASVMPARAGTGPAPTVP